jgi:hypothetical protein
MSSPIGQSAIAIREQLSRDRDTAFGPREHDALETTLDTASNALALLATETLISIQYEPDYITGSSAKEQTV